MLPAHTLLAIMVHAARPPEKLVLCAVHSGFGNQVINVGNSLLLGSLVGRRAVVPPIIDWGSIAFGGQCSEATSRHNRVSSDALKHYKHHWQMGNLGIDMVWDLTRFDVVAFDPRLLPPDEYDFSVQSALCAGSFTRNDPTGWLRPLVQRAQRLVVVGSMFYNYGMLLEQAAIKEHRLQQNAASPRKGDSASVASKAELPQHPMFAAARASLSHPGLPIIPLTSPWNSAYFSPRLTRSLGRYSCIYVRVPARASATTPHAGAAQLEALAKLKVRDSMATDRVYMSSNANASSLCSNLRKNSAFANMHCFTREDLPNLPQVGPRFSNGSRAFPPKIESMLVDLYACSRARAGADCLDYHSNQHRTSTFWSTIYASHLQHAREARMTAAYEARVGAAALRQYADGGSSAHTHPRRNTTGLNSERTVHPFPPNCSSIFIP